MILELRKACIEVIERIQNKFAQIDEKHKELLPKKVNRIFLSVANDIILLKDNFTLIMTKVTRLETKVH